MNRVILPQIAASQLNGLTQPVDICDEHGLVLGHFVPLLVDDPMSSCPHTPEQLNGLRSLPATRTLQDIWATLGVQ